jgi:hypothetical protein
LVQLTIKYVKAVRKILVANRINLDRTDKSNTT